MRTSAATLLATVVLASCTTPTSDLSSTTSSEPFRLSSADITVTANSHTERVSYANVDGKEVFGYLALPDGPGPHPAVVLIHEWWGLNDNIRENARRFAEQGYVALAVDLYEGAATTDQTEAGRLAGAVRGNTDRAMDNLSQAVRYLRNRAEVDDERLASVGWCFGGGWSYEMAKNDLGMDATVMYYGQFNADDDLEEMKSHIIGHFGEEDTSIKVDDVREFQATLQTQSGEHEVYIYPNAGHGFANEDNPNYNAEAADMAWQRTVAFLTKYVK
jgi:carboxymethylenebutenolidase